MSLENLLQGEPEIFTAFKTVSLIALFNHRAELRNFVVTEFNAGHELFLRKLYTQEGKIYAGISGTKGELWTFYVMDIPFEYLNSRPYPFYLDAN